MREEKLILDKEDRRDIVLWYRTGNWTQRALAEAFGTGRSTVYDLVKRYKNWSNKELLEKR